MIDAGYFIQLECRRGFEQCGWRTVMVPLDPPERLIEELLTAVVIHRPDMLFTVNHLGFDCDGKLTELLETIELPAVSWFVDSPAYILLDHRRNSTPLAITPIWERAYEPFLRGFGFQHTFHLPLAGDPDLFKPPTLATEPKYPVSFVGDSMTHAVEKWGGMCSFLPEAVELIRDAATELLNNRLKDPHELAQKLSGRAGINPALLNKEKELTLSSAIVLKATHQYRQAMVEALKGSGLHIFGDAGWREYTPSDAIVHEPLDYYRELPGIYNSTVVNLNTTSLQMTTAVNQRVFDVPLSGGFLLTDNQEDLELLFDAPGETATFSSVAELKDKTLFYLARNSLREKMIISARERIIREHTYRHRIGRIIAYARRVFGHAPVQIHVPA